MSRGISGGKQVMKFANTSNRNRVCLSSQNDDTILNSQNVQFKFRVFTVAAALRKKTTITSTHNLPLLSLL